MWTSSQERESRDPLFDGAGDARAICRTIFWGATPLGRAARWSPPLRTAVQLCLDAPIPIAVWAGPELTLLHNDAYRPTLGRRYPSAMGRPLDEAREPAAPVIRRVVETGAAARHEAFALTPVRSADGQVIAVLGVLEDPYRRLFDSIDEGLCVVEMIFDERGAAVDYRILEANPAHERMTGLPNVAGKRVRELVPAVGAAWIETFGRVAATGEPVRFEDRVEALDRWFEVHAAPLGQDGSPIVALVFHDVTERKRTEEACRSSEAGQALLLRLDDALRPLTDPHAVKVAAAELLARHLHLAAAGYVEVAPDEETIFAEGAYRHDQTAAHVPPRLTDLAETLRAGADVVQGDCAVASVVVNAGIVAYFYAVRQDPMGWREHEVRLLREVAERTWAAVERVGAEAARRKAEERLRTLIQNVHDYALFMLDAEGRITEWTEGAARVTGYAIEEAIGRDVTMFYPPDALPECADELEEARRTGRAERTAWRVKKGGDRLWVNEIATAIYDGAGTVVGFTKISRDLSEQKRVLDALHESEQRFRLLVQNVRDYALFLMDPDGRVASWGTGAEDLFGYREEEIIGRSFAVLFTPEDRAAGVPEGELATVREHGRASDDRWHVRQGGERFWASGVTTGLRDAGGAIRGFVKMCRDLTAKKLLDEQREALLELANKARSEAEAASRAKDEFLAVLGHELRTPLAPILLWGRQLQAGKVPGPEVRRAVEAIVDSAESLLRLIEDLLDLSRITSGRLELGRERTDVEQVARAAFEIIRPSAETKLLDFEMEVAPDVGAPSLDRHRFQQILWNLLYNAVKFTPAGGRVSLRIRRSDGQLVAEVADTGQGIEPSFLPHLFERFRQGDMRDSRAHGGLGIGLALTRQLVELHGGTVRAHSDGPGRGATFTVALPWTELDSDDDSPPPAPPARQTPRLRGLRVLLVEDDAPTRDAMVWTLEQAGAEVCATASAPEALARLAGHAPEPDVMVCDLGLPVMDGYELVQRVIALYQDRGRPAPPACAVSAHARDVDRRRAIEAGFDIYLAKPATAEQLLEVVEILAMVREEAALASGDAGAQ